MSAKENGATAVVFDDQQQVLLHQRRDFRVWALPGGRIEDGESGTVAAIRETQIVIQDALTPAAQPCKRMLTLPLMEVLLIRLLHRLRDLWQRRGL